MIYSLSVRLSDTLADLCIAHAQFGTPGTLVQAQRGAFQRLYGRFAMRGACDAAAQYVFKHPLGCVAVVVLIYVPLPYRAAVGSVVNAEKFEAAERFAFPHDSCRRHLQVNV